jgi:hypothetical protein
MFKFKKKRSGIDRRSGEDRRCNHKLAEKYFADNRTDPRHGLERRSEVERRSRWIKINQWKSAEGSKLGTSRKETFKTYELSSKLIV